MAKREKRWVEVVDWALRKRSERIVERGKKEEGKRITGVGKPVGSVPLPRVPRVPESWKTENARGDVPPNLVHREAEGSPIQGESAGPI